MKRILYVFGFFLLPAALLLTLTGDVLLAARSGCCKERVAYGAPWVQMANVDYQACESINLQKDGDNVLDRRGLIWWDSECQ